MFPYIFSFQSENGENSRDCQKKRGYAIAELVYEEIYVGPYKVQCMAGVHCVDCKQMIFACNIIKRGTTSATNVTMLVSNMTLHTIFLTKKQSTPSRRELSLPCTKEKIKEFWLTQLYIQRFTEALHSQKNKLNLLLRKNLRTKKPQLFQGIHERKNFQYCWK